MLNKIKKIILGLPARATAGLINLYRLLLSPDHSWLRGRFPHGYCRFYPSCSQYAKESIIKFGFLRGLWLSVKRLSRCHPWAEPRFDPVLKS